MFLAMCLLLVQTVTAQGSNDEAYDVTIAKQALAAKHVDKRVYGLSKEEMDKRTKEVERTLNVMIAEVAAGKKTERELKTTLEKMGVYMLETQEEDSTNATISSVSTNIHLNKVVITYDSVTARWSVAGGGYWTNDDWFADTPFSWLYVGQVQDIGGYDSVGITFYNTSGIYNTRVVSSLGYVTDHDGWSDWLYNVSHGDGSLGVAFDYQDKAKSISHCLICTSQHFTYYGKGFSATVTYDSNFANYNGYARTMYAHTWKSTSINSIGFSGGGGQFGVTVGWVNEAHNFLIFNGADTSF